LGEKLSYLESLQNGLVKLKTDYLQASGAEYGSSELIDAPELPASSFKYQQAAPFVSGFTSFKQPRPSVKPAPTPYQGTAEEQLPLPDFGGFKSHRDGVASPDLSEAETLSQPSAEGQKSALEETTSATLSQSSAEGHNGLYSDWLKAVQMKACKPSVRETWVWIQKRISNKETGSRTHDRTRISHMQKAFFSRAMKEGLMIENPNYTNGGKKYLWIA
ncbi:hypothetical protein, partial [Thiothrix eikelboomii]|uniref:hypothetical protein n=1 Tax=Thiothrix eikelboomii TaxID=92487 RepID=UPI003BB20AE7